MSVQRDAAGNRSVEANVEVPGTPEQVWNAIATGPGISSWMVPTTIEGRVGGTALSSFGPGMDSVATITSWNPPHSFAAETQEAPGTVGTEWIVESVSGDTCRVRVVHRWFSSTDDWDNQFIGHTYGWQAFFRILSLYLKHHAGQPSAAFQAMGFRSTSLTEAWSSLLSAFQIAGSRVTGLPGAPTIAGTIERQSEPPFPELLVTLESPAPGIAHLFAMEMGGQVLVSVRYYLYGPEASRAAAASEAEWQAWLQSGT